jgi:hypothetical protein
MEIDDSERLNRQSSSGWHATTRHVHVEFFEDPEFESVRMDDLCSAWLVQSLGGLLVQEADFVSLLYESVYHETDDRSGSQNSDWPEHTLDFRDRHGGPRKEWFIFICGEVMWISSNSQSSHDPCMWFVDLHHKVSPSPNFWHSGTATRNFYLHQDGWRTRRFWQILTCAVKRDWPFSRSTTQMTRWYQISKRNRKNS